MSTRSPTLRSNTPRTPARWRRSANRPVPLQTQSNSGAPLSHEHTHSDDPAASLEKAGSAGAERGRDAAAEGNDQPQLSRARHGAPARKEGRGHVRAGQSERTGDVFD